MYCVKCGEETKFFFNATCGACSLREQEEWYKTYHRRQDVSKLDTQKLVNLLLQQVWQHHCQIITDFMPNFPRPDTEPKCVIRHFSGENDHQFLRYSNGPLQGFFWDSYGDDFHSPELAIVALSQCPPPRGAICVSTHGN